MKSVDFFTIIIIVQIFVSVGINIYQTVTPDDAKTHVTSMLGVNVIDIKLIQTQMEGSISDQASMPSTDVGALAFYSGNIVLDLILNFALAVPIIATIVFQGIALLFNVDPVIMNFIETFVFVTFTCLYFFGLIRLLAGVRTGTIDY